MKKIYKYRLPFMEHATIDMPDGANVVRIDGLDGALWVWAVVDTNAQIVTRHFHLFKTGADMPDNILEDYDYLGCGAIFIQMELMMYVYELKGSEVTQHEPQSTVDVKTLYEEQ
jgi:limonene-1,2-epoxide hydrolase